MTTGPLGQGISSAVGMALAERRINALFGDELCNHYTYVIAGDGCLMEGISEEAITLAAHWNLRKLIVLWDNNNITIDGTVDKASSIDQLKRFEAAGWNVLEVDGHDQEAIEKAISSAQKSNTPTLIACKTIIGFGAPNKCGTSKCHGSPLGEEEVAKMRQNLNWQYPAFEVPQDILNLWRKSSSNNEQAYKNWVDKAVKNTQFVNFINDKLPQNWDAQLNELKQTAVAEKIKVATRKASQMCLEKIVPQIPQIVGGSADLAASNLTLVEGMKNVVAGDYSGNNIMYGIREHVMAAIMNGMALHGGVIPYGGTFFVFSDYMRPAIRLSALMGLRVIYVLTHDSIGVGEDGPTHQPIEHLASYRAMPNLFMFRPCDVVETAEAWQIALENEKSPSLLALSRQGLPCLREDCAENMTAKGGYIISAAKGNCLATIIATGSEVEIAMQAQKLLREKGVETNVVSMPCTELFDQQSEVYKEKVLGHAPKIVVEAASSFGWDKYVAGNGTIIALDHFGASAPAGELYKHFGITPEAVVAAVENCLK